MGRDRDLNTFIEDVLSKAQSEVKSLSTQKATLVINLKDLEKGRNKLSQEIYDLEAKTKVIKEESKTKADEILKSAKEKLSNAIIKESEATKKVSALDSKLKEANDLIKSNEGLKSSLVKQNEEAKNRIKNIKEKEKAIKEIIEDIGE